MKKDFNIIANRLDSADKLISPIDNSVIRAYKEITKAEKVKISTKDLITKINQLNFPQLDNPAF